MTSPDRDLCELRPDQLTGSRMAFEIHSSRDMTSWTVYGSTDGEGWSSGDGWDCAGSGPTIHAALRAALLDLAQDDDD